MVSNGILYVTVDRYVQALNATTGAQLWYYTPDDNFALSTPVVGNGIVYVTSGDNSIYALNATSGALVWSYQTGQPIYDAPVVANGMVYFGSNDDFIYALNATSGSLAWQYQTNGNVQLTPVATNSAVYAVSQDDHLYGLDANSGVLLWSVSDTQTTWEPNAANSIVYVASDAQNLYALNSATGATIWHYATPGSFQWEPVVSGGSVYYNAQYDCFCALNANSGVILWKIGYYYLPISPTVSNGLIYLANGSLIALSASTGAVQWQSASTPTPLSSPIVSNGIAYLANESDVYAFDATSGSLLWRYTSLRGDLGEISLGSGTLWVSDDLTLYALAASATETLLWQYFDGGAYSAPVYANGAVDAVTGTDAVCAFEGASGLTEWCTAIPSANCTGSFTNLAYADINGVGFVYFASTSCSDMFYAFNVSTHTLAWSYQTGNTIPYDPVVSNGIVYFESNDSSVYAFNGATGRQVWRYGTGMDSVPIAPLTVANGIVYANAEGNTTASQTLYALSASSGALNWKYTPGAQANFQTFVVANGFVYLNAPKISALSASTGVVAWVSSTAGSLLAVTSNALLGSEGNNVYGYYEFALNPETGALEWSDTIQGGPVFIATGDEQAYSVEDMQINGVVEEVLAARYISSGQLLWVVPLNAYAAQAPLFANGAVYVSWTATQSAYFHYVTAVNAYTGAVLWTTRVENAGPSTLTLTNNQLFAYSGAVVALVPSAPIARPAQGPTGGERLGGGNPSELGACYECAGDPVDTYSGNFSHTFSDLSIPGRGVALDFSHTYNAGAAAVNGLLGYGWTDSYQWGLTTDGAGNITIAQENGSTVSFAPNGAGGYTPPSRVLATLTKNGDGSYTFLRAQTQDRYLFTASGQLTAESDRNGYTTRLSYTGSGQLATVTDPAGRTLTFAYDGSGRISSVTDSAGRSVSFTYDGSGNLQTATDVGGSVTRFTYDSNHLLLTMTDPRGGVTINSYDGSGRVTSQQDPLGRVTTFSYTAPDSNGDSSATITDPNGHVTVDQYYNGLLLSETRGFGTAQAATWSYTYDPVSLGLASLTNPNGNITTQTWDAAGNLLSTTDALGRTTTSTYNSFNEVTTRTDALGVTTTSTYDAHGNLLSASTPLVGTSQSQTTTYTYGDATHPGDVTAMTDPNGAVWRYAYDAQGDRTRVTDPLHNTTTATYDALGRLTAQVSARGNAIGPASGETPAQFTTRYAYDAFGDVTQITDPLGGVTTKGYDADRNLVQETDADGHTTRYTYDADNELTQTTQPDGTVEQEGYDGAGNQTSQVDGDHNTTSYTYDALNRLTTVTDPLGRVTTYGYDGVGNRTSVTDAARQVTTYTYDAANQLTSVAYSDGQTPSVAYTYDADGQRLSMRDGTGTTTYTYDSLGRLVASTNGAGATVGYGYDLRDQLTSLTYPGGQRVTRAYDAAGRLSAVTDWDSNTSRFGYDADGDLTRETTANGVQTTLAYDANDRIGGLSYVLQPPPIQLYPVTAGRASSSSSAAAAQIGTASYPLSVVYGRDGLGQVTDQRTQGLPLLPSQTYQYTPLNQVSAASASAGAYHYDGAGDLTQRGSATLSYDAANEVTGLTQPGQGAERFTYDARGNRIGASSASGSSGYPTVSYGYDQANRLVAYSQQGVATATSATYAYDGDGLRASTTVAGVSGGATTRFAWQVNGALPLLLQAGSTLYVYGPNNLPLEQVSASGATLYFAQDQLGSTLFLTDSHATLVAAYAYDAYGAVTAHNGAATTALLYAGQYTDAESGLIYLRARVYDPATVQFLTRDPLAVLTRAPYGYASDNPLNATDPEGMFSLSLSDVGNFVFDYALGKLQESVFGFNATDPWHIHLISKTFQVALQKVINDKMPVVDEGNRFCSSSDGGYAQLDPAMQSQLGSYCSQVLQQDQQTSHIPDLIPSLPSLFAPLSSGGSVSSSVRLRRVDGTRGSGC